MSRNPKSGTRLSNPNDPLVRAALKHGCTDCAQPPGEWCVGIANGPTKGRRIRRIHFARCQFAPVSEVKAGAR